MKIEIKDTGMVHDRGGDIWAVYIDGKRYDDPAAFSLDFENPEENDWLAASQVIFAHGNQTRRADIVLFLNGLPVVVIELKNPADEGATLLGGQERGPGGKVTTVSRSDGAIVATTTFGTSPIYALTVLPATDSGVWAFSPNTGQSVIRITAAGTWYQLGSSDFSSGYATAPGDHTLIYLSDSSELKIIDVDAANAGDPGRDVGGVVATYSLPGTFTQAVTAPNGAMYLITGNNRLTIFAPQPVTV